VGDHIVQLAGDPEAFLGHRLPGLLLSFALQALGSVLERGGMGAPLPDAHAQDPGGGQQHVVLQP
jgi:hypothetical protein